METMNKVDMDKEFVEYMEGIGYKVPEVVTTEDILDMCILHWEDNLEGEVHPSSKYCGLCQMYYTPGGCSQCPLHRYSEAVSHEASHAWGAGFLNHWKEEDVQRMLDMLKKIREWYLTTPQGGGMS